MAHYVQIPKDLNDIKQKFMFGLTKRQVVSFGIGGVLGIPLFFLTRSTLGVSGAIFAMGAVAVCWNWRIKNTKSEAKRS